VRNNISLKKRPVLHVQQRGKKRTDGLLRGKKKRSRMSPEECQKDFARRIKEKETLLSGGNQTGRAPIVH